MNHPHKYPLEQLAIIKHKKLEEAEKALKEKKEALIKEEEKLKAVEKERDKVKEHRIAKLQQLRDKLDEGTSTDKIQQMKYYLKVVDEKLKGKELKVKEQQKQVENAQKQVELARQDFLKKQQDVEKLRLHREEWEKEMRLVLEHIEGVESDELGSAMHARKKSHGHPKKQ
ncbi:MAG: type III secretion T3S chaperone [Verrucomicrobia bacterium]|nr:type III secretion T3S chaperone [Verrucomicrobiota bacterium]